MWQDRARDHLTGETSHTPTSSAGTSQEVTLRLVLRPPRIHRCVRWLGAGETAALL
jgi:hypothetical protein